MAKWTEAEIAALRMHESAGIAPKTSAEMLSEEFGRPFTKNMVIGKRNRLGLCKPIEEWGKNHWTDERKALLRALYASAPFQGPGRDWQWITKRFNRGLAHPYRQEGLRQQFHDMKWRGVLSV